MTFLKKIINFVWSKQFLINIGLIVVLYIVGYFVLDWSIDKRTKHGQMIEVPNLIGKNQNILETLGEESELKYVVLDSIYDPSKVSGTILEQDPKATSLSDVHVKAGRTVKVRVSKNVKLVEMLNLISKSQRFGEKILENAGFRTTVEYKPSKEDNNAVIEQLYKGKPILAGTKIPIGSRIKLIVGRDEVGEPVMVPNVIGLGLLDAENRLHSVGNFNVFIDCRTCLTTSDSTASIVYNQKPEYTEGMMLPSGSVITIYAK